MTYPKMSKLPWNIRMIGITGKAGSGKDTVAAILETLLFREGKNYYVFAFANAVKEIAHRDFGWDDNKDDEGRVLLQKIGMAYRGINENYWIWRMNEQLSLLKNDEAADRHIYVIISDIRFINEADYVHKHGPLIMVTRNKPVDQKDWQNHVSEIELLGIKPDLIICNDSDSLGMLETEVNIYWKAIKEANKWSI